MKSLFLCLLFASPAADRVETARLLADLGAPAYTTREAASSRLMAIGLPVLPHIKPLLGRNDESGIRARAIYRRVISAAVASLEPLPWLDSFWFDVAQRRYVESGDNWQRYCGYYRRARGSEAPPNWLRWRNATRLAVSDWLEAGVPVMLVRIVLAGLEERSRVFLKKWDEENYERRDQAPPR